MNDPIKNNNKLSNPVVESVIFSFWKDNGSILFEEHLVETRVFIILFLVELTLIIKIEKITFFICFNLPRICAGMILIFLNIHKGEIQASDF